LTLTPNSNVTLSAGADYWLILANAGPASSYKWQFTDTLDVALPNYAVSHDDGATWTIGTPPGPFLIQVDGQSAAIPEPPTAGLFLWGLTALVLLAWYRSDRGLAGQRVA
jgi:hypothetical protein